MGKSPLWAAIDLTGVVATTGVVVEGGVADTDYDSTRASTALLLNADAALEFSGWVASDEYFSGCFFVRVPTTPGADKSLIKVYDQADAVLVEFKYTDADEIEFWFDGVLAQTEAVDGDLHRYCLRINSIDGRVQFIKDSADYIDQTGLDFTGFVGVSKIEFIGPVGSTAVSSIILDNEDTLTRYTVPLDFLVEDGTYNDLTGDVGGLTDRNNETGYQATAADEVTLFSHTPIPSIDGADVSCLCVTGQVGPCTAVAGFKYSVLFSGTVYDSTETLTPSGVGFATFDVNPNDTNDWSLADINTLKHGFKGA